MKISSAKTHLYRIPALQTRHDAIQTFTAMELLMVELTTSDGTTGIGYSYTIGTGGKAAKIYLDCELIPLLAGEDCELHQKIWDKMFHQTRASSGGPISAIARSAVDVAVWDAKARARGMPLFELLGGAQRGVPGYDTEGGWLNLSEKELVANAMKSLDRGFQAVKLKVGRESAAEDARRIKAVRHAIGPDVKLMVDANQGWTAGEAIRRARLFEPFDLYWLEEPLAAGDITGHKELSRSTSIPIAVGETIYDRSIFAEYLRQGAAAILQPDVARIGGITEWMKVAAMADCFQAPVAPHFLMEIQVHLAAAVTNGIFVEHIPQLGPVLEEELVFEDGMFRPPDRPGHGVLFDWERLKQYSVN